MYAKKQNHIEKKTSYKKICKQRFPLQKSSHYDIRQQCDDNYILSTKAKMTFRSLQMKHYRMFIPREQAYNTMSKLGQEELVHIIDQSDPLNQPFGQYLKRCDDNLHKIETMEAALKKNYIQLDEYDENEPLFVEKLQKVWENEMLSLGLDQPKLFDEYQRQLAKQYGHFTELEKNMEKLTQCQEEILEKIACYETVKGFFGDSKHKRMSQQYYIENISGKMESNVTGVSYIVGVIQSHLEHKLALMIYRISRGYACTKTLDIFHSKALKDFGNSVMLIIYPTSDSFVMERKLKRAMEAFSKKCYLMSELEANAGAQLKQCQQKYDQTLNLGQINRKQRRNFLQKIKDLDYLEKWRLYMWKQRKIYEALNKLQVRDQFTIANIYVPVKNLPRLSFNLHKMIPAPTLNELPLGNPPTMFETNSYTTIAQQITNTYGVPRYQEFNPSMFTTVTFPFFFGVMFGDIGHGGVLLAFGLFLVFGNDWIKKSSMKIFSQLRYMILLMGFFAFYCGWIYNDLIGFNTNFFGSCFHPQPATDQKQTMTVTLSPDPGCIYPFGIDPIWGRAENNLVFVNSLKMKISVIIAILHMSVGVCVKAANALYFRRKVDFYFEFIPQFIFLVGLFGYMDFLIIFKWLKLWDERVGQVPPEAWAPSVISTMMNVGLKLGQTGTLPNGQSNMFGVRGESWQDTLQLVILLVAVVCIPWMLFPKYCIEKSEANKLKKDYPLGKDELQEGLEERLNPSADQQTSKVEQVDTSELFVHQLIETIEFVLGAVSNTASYLRLWALSLAHSQLALVFFEKTLEFGFILPVMVAPAAMVTLFYSLCWITFGILMCMDSMECFLHSLRLHWVEFQNKFYKGDGYIYNPLSFKKTILALKNK